MKVGGLLEDDVARVRAVREALPDVDIMLDANSAYDVPTAVEAARAYEPLGIAWFEDPLPGSTPSSGWLGSSEHVDPAGERRAGTAPLRLPRPDRPHLDSLYAVRLHARAA